MFFVKKTRYGSSEDTIGFRAPMCAFGDLGIYAAAPSALEGWGAVRFPYLVFLAQFVFRGAPEE